MRRGSAPRVAAVALGLAAWCVLSPGAAATGSAPPARSVPDAATAIGLSLVRVPAGEFLMGSPDVEPGHQPNEAPVHRVRITRPFEMGRYEVTRGQFRAFVEATGYVTEAERDPSGGFGIDFATGEIRQNPAITWRAPGFPAYVPDDSHPIMLVSWDDAEAFCAWLSARDGRRYRLPTEAEWEYAARAGTTTRFAGGDDDESVRGMANAADADLRHVLAPARWAASWHDGFAYTAPVGRFRPNAFGLYDMHGNVWEWCHDWYGAHYYADSPVDDPQGPTYGEFRTIRGGGWFNGPAQNRSAVRVYFKPTFRYCLLSGFRVVRDR
jgi:formylglycine-generating enzyme required for sulfatase activity